MQEPSADAQGPTSEHKSHAWILDQLPELIARFDRELQVTFTNRAAAEQNQRCAEWFSAHPEDAGELEPWNAALQGVLRSGESAVLEAPMPGTSGRRWYRISLVPERDAKGEVTGVFQVAREITDRRDAEHAARASDERLAKLFEVLPIPAALSRLPEGVLVEVNRAFERDFGVERARALGKTTRDLGIHADAAARARLAAAVMQSGGVAEAELVLCPVDQAPRNFAITLARVDIDGQPYAIQTALDVTEQRMGQQALAESEERFRATFEQMAVGIAHVSPEGRFVRINQKLCDIVGYSREELTGRTFQDITHPDDLEADLAFVRRVLAGELATYSMEKRYLHRQGHVVWINLTVSLVHKADGSPDYFISVIEDIGVRKLAEAQRAALEEQLRAAQKLEAIGRLAGGVAHDFNNILSVILGHADLALESVRRGDPLRGDLQEMREAAERAAGLTRQLLAFSRKQILQPEVLSLNAVVRGIESMVRRLIGEDIEVRMELAEPLGNVKADPGQLEQVIMNLVVNARDAMPRGGLLTVATANRELDEAWAGTHPPAAPGPYAMLEVRDTGVGMSAETRAHIFEPFFTTKEQGKGTGLGLATVYGIVSQSGGSIWVYSEPGQGSTFRVYLPRVDAPAQPAKRLPEPVAAPRPATVLLVEDEETVRRIAERILKRAGYAVLSASGGGDALLLCEEHRGVIDLVLTDVVMPKMSGRELAERLAPLLPGVPVLFMSGYTDEVVLPQGDAAGAGFIAKPFTAAELSARVGAALLGAQKEPVGR